VPHDQRAKSHALLASKGSQTRHEAGGAAWAAVVRASSTTSSVEDQRNPRTTW